MMGTVLLWMDIKMTVKMRIDVGSLMYNKEHVVILHLDFLRIAQIWMVILKIA